MKAKRILALLLAAVMLAGMTPALAAGRFADVKPGSWYAGAVDAMAAEGYVNGVSETRFDPNGTMNRAMVVTILSRMGGGVTPAEPAQFRDVAADAWYARAVAWAQANGVAEGVGSGRFAPNEPVTREQLVTFLWRYAVMRYEPDFSQYYAEETFTEDDPVSDWAQYSMRLSIGSKVIRGRDTGDQTRWAAGETCTRAEAAMMLYRFLHLDFTDKEPAVLPEEALDPLAEQSLALFRGLYEPGKNTVASPLSVICALAMLDRKSVV